MQTVLLVGCGDVAQRLIPLLARYRVVALIRNPDRAARLRDLGAVPLLADLDQAASLKRVAGLANYVVYLAPPATESDQDLRLRALLMRLVQHKLPKKVIYISTSGVYGDCGGAEIDETRLLAAATARALKRVNAEQQLRHWGRSTGVSVSILRVPGIYARDRLPLPRLQQGTPCIVREQDSYTNHIHADDLARICVAALRYGRAGRVYHASDDGQLKMGDYFDLVADTFQLPRPPRIPRAEAAKVIPPMLYSFMNESRRLMNRRLKNELKVRLLYPTVQDFLQTIQLEKTK